jgi:hypothetical protein
MIAGSLHRFRALLVLTVLVGLAVIVAAAALRLPRTVVPVDLDWPKPRINITRGQYEHALAKWRAQKIEEYEITVDIMAFFGGPMTLHVSDYGNTVGQLAPVERPASILTTEEMDYLKEDTIEGMFAEIDAALVDSNVDGDSYLAYQVSFDPNLGYPRQVSRQPVPHVYDGDRKVTVTSLKIIKQGN